MKKGLYYGLLTLFIGIFLISASYLGIYFYNSMAAQNEYNKLSQLVSQGKDQPQSTVPYIPPMQFEAPSSGETVPEETGSGNMILPEYAPLYLFNSDIVGWIQIEGTKIDYPVMQSPYEKDYYLKRDFDKQSNKHGCIYVRETCDVFTPSDNVTIYGHHMRDGSMFAALMKYRKQEFFEEHRYIRFDTLLERHTYEVIAVFKTSGYSDEGFAYHRFENAADAEEFDAYVAKCKQLSFYDTGVDAQYVDKLITLSTCEYSLSNGRLVVVAKRVS